MLPENIIKKISSIKINAQDKNDKKKLYKFYLFFFKNKINKYV